MRPEKKELNKKIVNVTSKTNIVQDSFFVRQKSSDKRNYYYLTRKIHLYSYFGKKKKKTVMKALIPSTQKINYHFPVHKKSVKEEVQFQPIKINGKLEEIDKRKSKNFSILSSNNEKYLG